MKELLSPKNDYVFKNIFGNQHNVEILRGFLKSLLDIPDDEYDKITILDPHLNPDSRDGKKGILDVRVQTRSGKVIDIEVQLLRVPDLEARILFYISSMLTEQLATGDGYENIRKVISIVILDYDMINNPYYHNRFRLYDNKTEYMFCDLLEINTLELKKLPVKSDNSALYNWMSFLKAYRREEFEMIAKRDPVIDQAYAVLKEMSQDERERMIAESIEKAQRDEASRIRYARIQGKEEGREEGKVEGKAESKIDVAKNLISLGVSTDVIIKATGLTKEEIAELQT